MNITNLLAKRYIFSKRKGGFVSLIAWFAMMGIMLGVATLIVVTSLMNGIKEEMLGNFIGIDGHLRIQALDNQGGGANIADYEALIAQITPHLPKGARPEARVSPRIEGQVMVTGNTQAARGAQVMAMRAEDLANKPKLQGKITAQTQAQFAAGDGVIIGASMANSLGLQVGDAITLISPNGQATAFGTVPRIKAYPVIGLLELGMHAIDSTLIIMPYDKAMLYFAQNRLGAHPASYLEVTLPDMDMADMVGAKLQQELGGGYAVYPWQRIHASVFTALQVQRNVMVIILMLIVLVAAFNIISSLVMLVKDKSMDIAILRTLGASKGAIAGMFIKTGMMLGMIGTMLGLLLGVVAAENLEAIKAWIENITGQEILVANIYFLSTLPTKLNLTEVMVIVAASLLISLLATIYPAIKAASTQPAEALRHG
jgi:lipoprotein-releasing system permease protein